ncbi:MAG: hypothetical protein ACE5K9_00730, partial [Candidatus Methylomirabilales bacterium]
MRKIAVIGVGLVLALQNTGSWADSGSQEAISGALQIFEGLTLTPFIVGGGVGLLTFFLLEAARLFTRTKRDDRRSAQSHFWVFLLFLLPGWFYLLAFYVSSSSPWYPTILHVASAFLILALLALFLEVRHIAGVSFGDLARRMLSRKYLDELTVPELARLKRDVEETLVVAPDRRLRDGLNRFLETVHERALGTPYRVGYEEYTSLRREDDSRLVAESIVRYTLAVVTDHQNPIELTHQAEVPVVPGWGEDLATYLHALSLKVGNEWCVAQPGDDGELTLVSKGSGNTVIPIEFQLLDTPAGTKLLRYHFTYRFSPMAWARETMTPVEISEVKVLSPAGLLVSEMPAATHGATLVYTFPRDTETSVAVLGNTTASWEVVKTGGPEVVVSFRDWLLPGHGVVVSWHP